MQFTIKVVSQNSYRKFINEKDPPSKENILQDIVIAETAIYLEEYLEGSEQVKLSELVKYYRQVAHNLNLHLPDRVNSTRLRKEY